MKNSMPLVKIVCFGLVLIGFLQPNYSQTKYFTITSTGIVESESSYTPSRKIVEETADHIIIDYDFSGFSLAEMKTDGTVYQIIRMEGFGLSLKAGIPSLPYRAEKIALPADENPVLSIIKADFIELEGYHIIPAPEMPADASSDITHFIANEVAYSTNAFFPDDIVTLGAVKKMKETSLAMLKLQPVQFNPVSGKLRIYTTLTVQVDYGTSTVTEKKIEQTNFVNPILNNIVVNPQNTQLSSIEKAGSSAIDPTGYIIVTTPEYFAAVDSFANWKRQLGYRVEILMQSSWEISEVASAVRNKYFSLSPRPSYLLIFGDQQDVPDYYYENIYLDPVLPVYSTNYYACMDGWNDYIPEMAHGRIPVNSLEQAYLVVQKIMNYEKSPPDDPTFYRKGLHAGYFQDSTRDGTADKRYAHTSIELYDYLTDQGYESDRVFYTEEDVTPVQFNPYYSGNTTIPPEYLKQNGYPWDGDKEDIINAINDGRFYVFHRDHGLQHEWVSPHIDVDDLDALHNGNETPVVLSVNCSSGMFWKEEEDECFAEKLLRHPNGGAVGIVASTEENRSGYNDGFIFGMIDAIWADPGIVPDLGGGKDPDPDITPHDPIYTMGDVMIQGLIRMTETWDTIGWADRDHFNLYHYFGDPAMQIWTDIPVQATAQHASALIPGATSISISGSNCSDGIATIFYHNDIQAKIRLSGGSGTLTFPQPLAESVNEIVLTIHKHNYIPYQAVIPVGNQPIAQFSCNVHQSCPMSVIEFYDESLNEPENWTWEITPTGSFFVNGTNTHSQNPIVFFNTSGSYHVKLTVSNADGSNSITKLNYIRISEAPDIPFASDTLFCGQGSAALLASGSTGNFQWWNSVDKQVLLSDSAFYQTPVLNNTTSYFVEALPDLVTGELSTDYDNTNYANGNMFDITVLNEIRIDSLSLNIHDYLEHTVEVYFKQGSYEGSEHNPDDWALIGTYQVTGKGSNVPASVDIDDTHLSAGETYGFYVTLVNGSLGYTHGGNTYSGEDIYINCGAGVVYPFSTVYAPRTWNGTVHYSIGEYSCNSGLKEVQVIIIPIPEPPENQFHDVCYDNDSLILFADGEILTWYMDSLLTDTLTSGESYQPNNLEVGLNTYYLTERINTCISDPGKITVNLHEPVDLPVTRNSSVCFGDTALLMASGDSIRWYENGVLFGAGDTILISGDSDGFKHYEVTNTIDGCESKALTVELLVHPQTPVPKSMDQTVCEKDTVILSAEGSQINWYDYNDLSLILEDEDTLVLNAVEQGEHKIIVTNELNGCESDTIIVAVKAKALPELPVLVKQSFCEGEFVSLVAEGENIRWFTDELMTELVSDSSVYEAGYLDADTYMYYLDQTIDGCASELNPQQVVVNSLPDIDLGADTSIYLGQELVVICDEAGEYTWQDNSTGNSFRFVADDFGLGIYKVSVFVINEMNCSDSGQIMIEVKDPLGHELQSDDDFILVYPNPTSGRVTLQFKQRIGLPLFLSIFDATGRCIMKKEIECIETGDQIELDLTKEAKGLYTLIIGNKEIESGYRIIRE